MLKSFSAYTNYATEDKSTNAHNCRKSALMSIMFGVHKLVSVLGLDHPNLNNIIGDLFLKYAKPYIELTSVVSDLQFYALYLSPDQRTQILEALKQQAESKKADKMRFCKA